LYILKILLQDSGTHQLVIFIPVDFPENTLSAFKLSIAGNLHNILAAYNIRKSSFGKKSDAILTNSQYACCRTKNRKYPGSDAGPFQTGRIIWHIKPFAVGHYFNQYTPYSCY